MNCWVIVFLQLVWSGYKYSDFRVFCNISFLEMPQDLLQKGFKECLCRFSKYGIHLFLNIKFTTNRIFLCDLVM